MCFNPDTPEVTAEKPPEVLRQSAPDKKKTAQSNSNNLAIGTKRYRATGGAHIPGGAAPVSPTGIKL